MEYIQVSDEYNARALWLLFTHSPTKCLPLNIYSVSDEQLEILRREGIPFTKTDLTKVDLPSPATEQ